MNVFSVTNMRNDIPYYMAEMMSKNSPYPATFPLQIFMWTMVQAFIKLKNMSRTEYFKCSFDFRDLRMTQKLNATITHKGIEVPGVDVERDNGGALSPTYRTDEVLVKDSIKLLKEHSIITAEKLERVKKNITNEGFAQGFYERAGDDGFDQPLAVQ